MNLLSFLTETGTPFEKNVPLSKKTWIKTGGICGCWISPTSVEQLAEVCRYLQSNGIKFDIVGQTSNIFFHSTYNPEVIVSTARVNNYNIDGDIITCDCGWGKRDEIGQGLSVAGLRRVLWACRASWHCGLCCHKMQDASSARFPRCW